MRDVEDAFVEQGLHVETHAGKEELSRALRRDVEAGVDCRASLVEADGGMPAECERCEGVSALVGKKARRETGRDVPPVVWRVRAVCSTVGCRDGCRNLRGAGCSEHNSG